jgi:hypothetical protein
VPAQVFAMSLSVSQCGQTSQQQISTDELGAALVSVPRTCDDDVSVTLSQKDDKGAVSYVLLRGGFAAVPAAQAASVGETLELEMPATKRDGALTLRAYLPTVRAAVEGVTPLWVRVQRGGEP